MDRRFKKRIVIISMAVLSLGLVGSIEYKGYCFRWNRSESLPYSLFLSQKINDLSKGMYVLINHPVYSDPIGKKIAGLPGELIKVVDRKVYVEGQLIGEANQKSKSGKSYHPITEGMIPAGYVFASANHLESFDSRYKEFGLIKIEWIQEELCPLF